MIRGCGSVNFTISSISPAGAHKRARTSISIDNALQITPISRGVIFRRQGAQAVRGDEAFQVGDLFGTADEQALPMLDRSHELGGLQERVVSAGVEPRIAASELDDLQFFETQIVPVYIADLELTAG